MTDLLKTYVVSIPSVALALMAMHSSYPRKWTSPPQRACGCFGCRGYFRRIDRITRGEKP